MWRRTYLRRLYTKWVCIYILLLLIKCALTVLKVVQMLLHEDLTAAYILRNHM